MVIMIGAVLNTVIALKTIKSVSDNVTKKKKKKSKVSVW
jgi:hypothetical protein